MSLTPTQTTQHNIIDKKVNMRMPILSNKIERAIKPIYSAIIKDLPEMGVRSVDSQRENVFNILKSIFQFEYVATTKIILPILPNMFSSTRGMLEVKTSLSQRLREVFKDNQFILNFLEVIDVEALDYADYHALINAGAITDRIEKVIYKGFSENQTYSEIADKLSIARKTFQGQATYIARNVIADIATEASFSYANEASSKAGVLMYKTWLPTEGSRTRDAHAVMANHPSIPINENFIVNGESMARPRDPNGSLKNIINCRCTMSYQVKGLL